MQPFTIICLIIFGANSINCKLNGEGNQCGRPFGTLARKEEAKIVGGYDIGYFKYPWYVALISSNVIACGGGLVGSKFIITAAHCYKEYIDAHNNKTSDVKLETVYQIMLGVYNKCEKEKTQKVFQAEKVHIHEKYQDSGPYFDIALVVLKESAAAYQPVCLPKSVIKPYPKEATVPGLGTLKYHGSTPCTLHEARILIYSDDECKKMINRTGNDPNKIHGAFCAGYLQGGIDTCQGDSGGPLQITDEYGNNVLLGIVSFGFHCANPGMLGMYTDVSQYIDWIETKTGFKSTMEGQNTTEGSNDNDTVSLISSGTTDAGGSSDTETKPPGKPHHPTKKHIFSLRPIFSPINIIILKKNKELQDRKRVLVSHKKSNIN